MCVQEGTPAFTNSCDSNHCVDIRLDFDGRKAKLETSKMNIKEKLQKN
jgi:hypothetical protein